MERDGTHTHPIGLAALVGQLRRLCECETPDTDPSPTRPAVRAPRLVMGAPVVVASIDPVGTGLRSAAVTGWRELIVAADDVLIAIDLSTDGDGVALRGQVIGIPAVSSVQVVRDDEELGLAVVDEAGEFELRPVPCGPAELVVTDGAREIVVPVEL